MRKKLSPAAAGNTATEIRVILNRTDIRDVSHLHQKFTTYLKQEHFIANPEQLPDLTAEKITALGLETLYQEWLATLCD